MSEEYFYFQFKDCPYCHSGNIDMEDWKFFGAHRYASYKCFDCEKKWSTSDSQHQTWQIPKKGEL